MVLSPHCGCWTKRAETRRAWEACPRLLGVGVAHMCALCRFLCRLPRCSFHAARRCARVHLPAPAMSAECLQTRPKFATEMGACDALPRRFVNGKRRSCVGPRGAVRRGPHFFPGSLFYFLGIYFCEMHLAILKNPGPTVAARMVAKTFLRGSRFTFLRRSRPPTPPRRCF